MMIRQLANGVARVASRASFKGVAPVAMRSFSDLQKKERGDEARYFAQEEARRLAEMKAKVEAIMASENADDKEHLTNLLSTYQLDVMDVQAFFSLMEEVTSFIPKSLHALQLPNLYAHCT